MFHEVVVIFILNHRKKCFFLSGSCGFTPPLPLSGPTTNKNHVCAASFSRPLFYSRFPRIADAWEKNIYINKVQINNEKYT